MTQEEWVEHQLAKAPAPTREQLRAIREVVVRYRQSTSSES